MSDVNNRSASFQHILNVTEQLIEEKGCRQTTLQEIIDRSGLSKGAIYHYVSGKDELFGLILKAKVEKVNEQFIEAVAGTPRGESTLPIQSIAQGMAKNSEKENVSNKIFTYLLSQNDNPKIAAILNDVYEFSLRNAINWIEAGQKGGAIPLHVDPAQMAMIFMVFSYGLRVHNVIVKEDNNGMKHEDIFRLIFRFLQ